MVRFMDKNQFEQMIKKSLLFSVLDTEQLREVYAVARQQTRSYKQGQLVRIQGESCHTVDLILAGKATVQKIDADGNILIIEEFLPGEMVGANLVFASNNKYPMTIVARTHLTIWLVKPEFITTLCRRNPSFMAAFFKVVADRSRLLATKIKAISRKPLRKKIVEFLTFEFSRQNISQIRLPFSKKEWAERLGVQRTSLSRELKKMKEEGLLNFDARHIYINEALWKRPTQNR